MVETTTTGWKLTAVCVATLAAGCSGGEALLKAPASLVTGAAEKIAAIPVPELPQLPAIDADPTGSPTEIYTRVARGITVCWFGAHGALKGVYIMHAEAEPPARGGRAEIVIHEKDASTPNPRGNRAFRVQIVPSGETATVDAENARFPLEIGQKMRADVRRWARGDLSCSDSAATKGWEAEPKGGEPDAAAAKPKPKGRERQT